MRNTFKKTERLCSKIIIEHLLKEGNSFFVHPFKVVHQLTILPEPVPIQIMIGATKRHYKTAVKRNAIKRYIREAYRTNKQLLQQQFISKQQQCAMAILCVAPDTLNASQTNEKIKVILHTIQKFYESA